MNLDAVIDWKRIVAMFYQMTGKNNPNKDELSEEIQHKIIN